MITRTLKNSEIITYDPSPDHLNRDRELLSKIQNHFDSLNLNQKINLAKTATLSGFSCSLLFICESLANFDIAFNDNYIFRNSCMSDNKFMVKYLLDDPRINPADMKNHAFRTSVSHQNLDMINILLGDPRIDPSDEDNSALEIAIESGNKSIISILQSHPAILKKAMLLEQFHLLDPALTDLFIF